MSDMTGLTRPKLRIAALGGSGFLGRPLVRQLRGAGHDVWILRRTPSKDPRDIVLADLSDSEVHRALEPIRPDVVINLIWVTSHGEFWNSSLNHSSLDFSRRLSPIAADVGAKRLIGVGSSAEYRSDQECVQPGPDYEMPTSLYGQSKLEAGRHMLSSCSALRISGAWARVFQLYGPGENSLKFISTAIASARNGMPIAVREPSSVRDWIHVEDAAAALADLAVGNANGTFNIGTGQGTTTLQVARLVSELTTGSPQVITQDNTHEAPIDSLVACISSSLVVRKDFSPRPIREGILDVITATGPRI